MSILLKQNKNYDLNNTFKLHSGGVSFFYTKKSLRHLLSYSPTNFVFWESRKPIRVGKLKTQNYNGTYDFKRQRNDSN